MQNFAFQTVASRKIQGYTQAVSDDGSIMITRTKGSYYAYYFDGKSIIEIPFFQGQYVKKVPSNYEEQSANYFGIKTRVVEDRIVVYILSEDRQKLSKFSCPKIEGADCLKEQRTTTELVQSMQLHPLQDSLMVTFSDSFQIVFTNSQTAAKFDLILGQQVIESSLIYPVVTDSQCFLYFFCVERQHGQKRIRVIKVHEYTYQEQYKKFFVEDKEIEANSSSIYLDRVEFDEQLRVFGTSLTERFDQLSQWGGVTFFIDESGNQLESTGLELYGWAGFMSPHSIIATANFIPAYLANTSVLVVSDVCTMQYRTSSVIIDMTVNTEICAGSLYPYYDRIALWMLNNTKYIITQHEQIISMWDDELNLIDELSGYGFSTKMDDVLLVNTFGELHYMQYKEAEDDNDNNILPETSKECEVEVGMLVGLVCLSVLIVGLIGLLVYTCGWRKKSETSRKKILTKKQPRGQEPQLENPYVQDSTLPLAPNPPIKQP